MALTFMLKPLKRLNGKGSQYRYLVEPGWYEIPVPKVIWNRLDPKRCRRVRSRWS